MWPANLKQAQKGERENGKNTRDLLFQKERNSIMYNKTLTLPNGVVVPQLALGTWFIPDDQAAAAVQAAADLGYRHFDTAQAYGNERGVGEGVRTCGVKREELFVTTKVAAEHKDYESAKAGIDANTPQGVMLLDEKK
jgi:diketogulonate reductase-like aldo/keto reductase